ncbi:MAG: polysaccharide deacetylase family protein [Vampirovibrionales bacterium]
MTPQLPSSSVSNAMCTIVMYHYVRDVAGSRYPNIKALPTAMFERQLQHFTQHYQGLTLPQFLECLNTNGSTAPPNPLLLTFDDGYRDHIDTVAPLLNRYGLHGVFAPPVGAVKNRQPLIVNVVHAILSHTQTVTPLVAWIFEENRRLQACQAPEALGLASEAEYRQRYEQANRFDTADVILFKRLLQHALPPDLRWRYATQLAEAVLPISLTQLVDDFYMTVDDLKQLVAQGHSIAGHSHQHDWMNTQTPEQQHSELLASQALLTEVGMSKEHHCFVPPYGAYNETTLTLMQALGFHASFTTQVGKAPLMDSQRYQLPRLDANDFLHV